MSFPAVWVPIQIEQYMIRNGGRWRAQNGRMVGEGLFFHYKALQSILWPNDDHHRWSDLILRTYCEEEITVITGCGDSGKTWGMSKLILCDYWTFADKTLWLISTTEGRGSELRIWGCIKDLFNAGREKFPWLPGVPLDFAKTITTDEIDDDKEFARSIRRGLIIVPCKAGGVVSGLAPYIGIKSPRLRHAGDEVAAMSDAFLNAYANWYGKEDFKGIMAGNFMETDDPLGVACEPEDGWESFIDSGKTQEWRSKFYGAKVLALDGRDSPNYDFPASASGRQKFPYLIGPKKLEGVLRTKGMDSWEWYSQCVGKPVQGMDIWRVFSKDFCRRHKAYDDAVWKNDKRVTLYSLDPAYGGGDRCVGRKLEFGEDVSGKQILLAHKPEIIKVVPNTKVDPEDQIAAYVFKRLSELHIAPFRCFYDSFGRGTLGFAFSKVFGHVCPVPVDSSARPTKRPVRFDMFVEELIGGQIKKRLKRCDEHYIKFITEMWFSTREAVDAEQIRGVDDETISEGCSRKFSEKNGKKEVEPKDEMKERTKKSPDLMDNLCIGVEGARQLGFRIERIVLENGSEPEEKHQWLEDLQRRQAELLKSKQLNYQ